MRQLRLILPLLLVLCAVPLAAQTRDIKTQEQALQKLRDEIKYYEQKLKESVQKERRTVNHLDALERQTNLIRRLLSKLKNEEELLNREIAATLADIKRLEEQVRFRKNHYASYVRTIYKHGRVYDTELILSSNSINQLYIRLEYLRRFSEQRRTDIRRIQEKKQSLEEQNARIEQQLVRQRKVISEKTSEQKSLSSLSGERKQTLRSIRSDKKLLQRELTRRNAAKQKVEQLIAELVEKERIRKEREAAAARERERRKREELARRSAESSKGGRAPVIAEDVPPLPVIERSAFKPSSLRWPVETGKVASKFGNQVHPILKTVTQNNGIEIATPAGSNVVAVGEGEVALVSFIAGFGNVVILNHQNSFRTVYAHLLEVTVDENQPVREGQVIGKSGDTVSGDILHFEIWREREKLDPERWLVRR